LDPKFSSSFLNAGFDKALTWYVCGPTVYDASHIGHARTYTNFDIMRRILLNYHQIPLIFAMGVTDIDDKIINRSAERKMSWLTLARFFENEFNKDLEKLNILPPDMSLRVSEFIPDIISYIERLSQRGFTYTTRDGVYFDVSKFSQKKYLYGKLRYSTLNDAAKQVQEALMSHDTTLFDEDVSQPAQGGFAQRGEGSNDENNENNENNGETNPQKIPNSAPLSTPIGHAEKRHPADFCLWKFQKSPHEPAFESSFGVGRPGWHIECSAMTASALGVGLDIHSGGVDLKFPHHCNEIAQAEGCLGWGENHLEFFGGKSVENKENKENKEKSGGDESLDEEKISPNWTTTWIHTGHLNIQGLKMSKSLKNFITIQQLFKDGYTADEFRMLCATTPYNSTLDYTPVRLQQCRQELNNIKNFKEVIKRVLKNNAYDQVNLYNSAKIGPKIQLNHNNMIEIVGGNQDDVFDCIAHVDYVFSSVEGVKNDNGNKNDHKNTSAQNSPLSGSDQLKIDTLSTVYLNGISMIRPKRRELELQRQFINSQALIHNYLSTDFNTQQTISTLTQLLSATTRYISDVQQEQQLEAQKKNLSNDTNNNTNNNTNNDSEKSPAETQKAQKIKPHVLPALETSIPPPSQYLLTQISVYTSKIYNILGFQFAGSIGGSWTSLPTQLPFTSPNLTQTGSNNPSNLLNSSNPDTIQRDNDGIPLFLHNLAAQRSALKQVAVEGGKLHKKMNKLKFLTIPSTNDATPSTTPIETQSSPQEQVVIDKVLLDELIGQLKRQNSTVLGVCDVLRDKVFPGANYTLKDTASAASGANANGQQQASYFISHLEQKH
jgi:cysteinyl-tRNA synthetase